MKINYVNTVILTLGIIFTSKNILAETTKSDYIQEACSRSHLKELTNAAAPDLPPGEGPKTDRSALKQCQNALLNDVSWNCTLLDIACEFEQPCLPFLDPAIIDIIYANLRDAAITEQKCTSRAKKSLLRRMELELGRQPEGPILQPREEELPRDR